MRMRLLIGKKSNDGIFVIKIKVLFEEVVIEEVVIEEVSLT